MLGTDMNIAQFFSATNYQLGDYWSKIEDTPQEDSTLGGTMDLKNVTYVPDGNGNAVLTYTRAFNTGDKWDAVVQINTSGNYIMAWGVGGLADHNNNFMQSSFIITSNTSNNTVVDTTTGGSSPIDFWAFHGISLVIGWSVFNFFGYIAARFLKHYTWWIWVHRIGSGLNSFWSIGVVGVAINMCMLNN